MFIKKYFILLLLSVPLVASINNLRLNTALEMLEKNNLELKISKFNEQMKGYESAAAEGHHYGKLDLAVSGMRSNDAGNVFGFKLQSREATFGDFGFSEFNSMNPDILSVQPADLNYPEARNHFLTKISYMLPLYTGGKLTEYGRITKAMEHMSQYDTQKILNEKIFQTKKAFYDISLIENYIYNLSRIMKNINHLESIVQSMKTEGYAKDIDTLEVQARRAEADSMYNQAKLNRDLAYQFLSFLLDEEVSSIKKVNDMAPMPLLKFGVIIDRFAAGEEEKRDRSRWSPVEFTRISVIVFWLLFIPGGWMALQQSRLLMVGGIAILVGLALFLFTAVIFSMAVLNQMSSKRSGNGTSSPVAKMSGGKRPLKLFPPLGLRKNGKYPRARSPLQRK